MPSTTTVAFSTFCVAATVFCIIFSTSNHLHLVSIQYRIVTIDNKAFASVLCTSPASNSENDIYAKSLTATAQRHFIRTDINCSALTHDRETQPGILRAAFNRKLYMPHNRIRFCIDIHIRMVIMRLKSKMNLKERQHDEY